MSDRADWILTHNKDGHAGLKEDFRVEWFDGGVDLGACQQGGS